MKKNTKLNWQIIAFAAFAALTIMFAAPAPAKAKGLIQNNSPAFASQNRWLKNLVGTFDLTGVKPEIEFGVKSSLDDEYPTPDFSAMAKYIEVRKWEYDIYATPPQLHLLIAVKVKSRPRFWTLRWEDADGVLIDSSSVCDTVHSYPDTELNVPLRCNIWIPDDKKMKRIKSVRAVRRD